MHAGCGGGGGPRGGSEMLRHALTSFPKLERLVYSTCSVHVRENEAVVASVLPQAERLGFELATALPGWHRRGWPSFEGAERCVRVDPKRDKTDGFFIALFVKKGKGKENGKGEGKEEGGG